MAFKKLISIEAIFVIFVSMFFAYIVFTDKTYVYDGTSIILTRMFDSYLVLGIFCTLSCFLVTLANKSTIPRIEFIYILTFIPLEIVLLVLQFVFNKTEYVSITYILPFIIFYVLFHSNPYDEITGCQNRYSYETQFMHSQLMHRNHMIINIMLPKGRHLDYSYFQAQVAHIAADKCRKVEKIGARVRIYSLSSYNYAIFVTEQSTKKCTYIVQRAKEILEEPTKYGINSDSLTYKMIVFKNHPFIDSTQKLVSMQHYLFDKIDMDDMRNECYIATDKDYEDFITLFEVEMLLNDIKSKMDLDDKRVLCFAQPIYCVETNSFRTAEALMRLDLNGKVIYPDKFISVAERNGTIHSLTLIILNKVCKMIKSMEGSYDFDAVTINCSAIEFSNKNLHKELLEIIKANNVPYDKIRIELTESAMSGDYETLIENVEKLRAVGIQFYLDDFGTGYSNLERILGCPFNTIKFDKSLLYKSIDDSRMDDLIVSMAQVFKKQGFTLLVEGVETDEQTRYCVNRGFSYIQGYKYAKPQPIEHLTDYFKNVCPQ
jgi:EAL domain-containing protein (putative c-di-GMP-specific phosphodiesterase class I)